MLEFNCFDLDFARNLKIYTEDPVSFLFYLFFVPIQAKTGLGIVIMGVSGSGKS
jgi:ABC-type lipoprotein export system ATPase subunit